MKVNGKVKKFCAALLIGAVSAASMFSFVGCGEVSLSRGESVSEDVWAKAFENLRNGEIKNYTVKSSQREKSIVSGVVYTRNYSSDSNKSIKNEISYTIEDSSDEIKLCDMANDKYYSEYSIKSNRDGKENGEKDFTHNNRTSKEYYELSEIVKSATSVDYKKYWKASTEFYETKSDTYRELRENEWSAYETGSFGSSSLYGINKKFYYDYDGVDISKAKSDYVAKLYAKFEYNKGFYTANLYLAVDVYSTYNYITAYLPCTVTLSFKDGQIIGYGVKYSGEGVETKANEYDLKYKINGETAYGISDIGTTKPEKKVNSKITKALDKAKAEKERNK